MRDTPYQTEAEPAPLTPLDELAFAAWKRRNIQPARPASDAVFLRRVYLDATGALPTPDDAAQFLADPSPAKRAALIDRLLSTEAFADYQAMKWCDTLRVKAEFPINLWPNAVQSYYRFIRAAVKNNLPYHRFARALLTSSGSNFRDPESNFYRATQSRDPQSLAQAVALTFLGARAEKWPKPQLDGLAAFFSRVAYKSTGEWKEEIVYFDDSKPAPANAAFPDGRPARLSPNQDPREAFADWLLAPGNPWFARAAVNRVWYWLLGRGIVHEPDDIRPDNPPSIPELLAYLEQELAASRYDLKRIYRLILNSQVYQLSSIPRTPAPEAAALFAFYPVRRLEAETLIDAICAITGTNEQYWTPAPEPYTFLPEDQRAVAIPDGSISSAFLEMFGRPPRDTGLQSERNNRPTADQRLHLLNSSHIQLKIQQSPKLRALVRPQPGGKPRDPLDRIYLAVLSRYPTAAELATAAQYFQSAPANKWPALVDLTWALINTSEFLCRH